MGIYPIDAGVSGNTAPVDIKTASEYVQWNKQPYAAEYFGLPNLPTYAKGISSIDQYVVQELQVRNFDDTLDNYRSILEELSSSMGLSPRENSTIRLNKMSRWITQVLLPQQKINQRKAKILGHANYS